MPLRALLLLALALQGCATLSETECRGADWFNLGLRDGENGYSRNRVEEHRSACGEFQLAPDVSAWTQGYEAGLEGYCEVANGYRVGRQGGHYGGVCPAEHEADFVAAFRLGSETNQVERELAQVAQAIDTVESRLTSDRKLSDEARASLRRQLRELDYQAASLRRSRDRLENEWRYRFTR